MPNVGAIIKSQVDLELSTPKLQQQMQWLSAAIDQNAKAAKRSLSQNITAEIITIERRAREMARVLRDAYKAEQPPAKPRTFGQVLSDFGDRHRQTFQNIARGGQELRRTAAVGTGMVVGATYAAAAAAGSTTLDTFTGSIRMLTLEIGAGAQPAIMALSRWIQRMAKDAKNMPDGTVGGVAGGLAGSVLGGLGLRAIVTMFSAHPALRVAGLVGGAVLGGLGGAIGGSRAERALARDERIEQMARAFVTGGEDLANKAHVNIVRLFNRTAGRDPTPAEKKQIEAAEEVGHALKRSEDPEFRKRRNEFLTAGLDMPASFTDMADLRRQAQLAVFDKGGPLEAANAIRELELNLNAIGGRQVDILGKIEENTRKPEGERQAEVRPAMVG